LLLSAVQLPTPTPSARLGLALLPLLTTAGVLGVTAAPAARANVVITNPSSLDDFGFECLKGRNGCSPALIEENWVVEGSRNFTRINEWTSNGTNSFIPRDEQNQTCPLNQTVPFFVDYIKATEEVVFRLEFGGTIGTKVSTFDSLTRSPTINTLYFRVASGRDSTAFQTSLTNLMLTTSPGTATQQTFSIGNLTANGLESGREVKYAVVTGLPDSDFRITGDAFFAAPCPTSPCIGNWQIKAAYTVPGPLPILGGAAAFGWSRRLRRLTRR
jgi:hypothetical protein